MKFDVKIHSNYVKVYIDETLHVCFRQKDLVGIHAYKEADSSYFIEYHLINRMIECEYNTQEKWQSILKLIDALKL